MSEVERYWIEPSRLVQEGWHQDDTCVVKDWAYDRVVAERDALQQLLNQRDEQVESLKLQPPGEQVACMPVERCYDVRTKMIIAFNEAKKAGGDLDDALDAAYKSALRYSPSPMSAEQPEAVAVVPEGYCIMPRQLTAENGAKALLLGEFKLLVTMEYPECCEPEEPTEGYSICDGEGEYGQKHTIPWDQIKFIYSRAVSGLAVKIESSKSR
ncbi:hypothetical protein [Pseudomonas sp. GXZC]|uniref:hypothetical protein n=1 Tax=Pseudomonas sp. GXZC TaxID=3003351 RepID=UPI0022AAE3F9|nr:hypothetical protein [Pseudomonas sp. GXZC]WAT26771.1 hypothetical protein OZ428_22670 [Pseudomonas sp. GXZC]